MVTIGFVLHLIGLAVLETAYMAVVPSAACGSEASAVGASDRTHFAVLALPFTLLQNARQFFLPGSFVHDMWWLLVAAGSTMLFSLFSLLRNVGVVRDLWRAFLSRSELLGPFAGLLLSLVIGAEGVVLLEEESVLGKWILRACLCLSVSVSVCVGMGV